MLQKVESAHVGVGPAGARPSQLAPQVCLPHENLQSVAFA